MGHKDAPEPQGGGEITATAHRIRAEALDLAQQYLAKSAEAAAIEQQARQLQQQMRDLVGQPGHQEPDVQRALSDAILDIRFIFAQGKGPSSVQLQLLLRKE